MSSDTKIDPWALLREARESHCPSWRFRCGICSRIDAALAAYEAEERGEVEWQEEVTYDGVIGKVARLGNSVVRIWPRYDKTFDWKASVVWSKEGKTSTLDEAKSAAIAAARGMR